MNFRIFSIVFALTIFVSYSQATNIQKCQGETKKLEASDVKISECEEPPCVLKKKSTINVEQKFTPDKDLETLKTTVYAVIASIPLPFIGVDNRSACDNIYEEDGNTKAGCPLKAGTNYIYKNSFDILTIYPSTSLIVHWALTSDKQDITCFEVPSKIVN